MKNYEVEAIKCFTDKLELRRRNVGDRFFCDKERYILLKQNGAVKLIEIKKVEDDVEESKKEKYKKRKNEKK